MSKKSGIGDLIKAAQPTAGAKGKTKAKPTPEPTGKPVGKSADSDYGKLCVYPPKTLIKRLRIAAIDGELDLSDATAEALEGWLEGRDV